MVRQAPTRSHGSKGYLTTVMVAKSCVIAYFARRGKQEIVVNPDEVPEPHIARLAGR